MNDEAFFVRERATEKEEAYLNIHCCTELQKKKKRSFYEFRKKILCFIVLEHCWIKYFMHMELDW